jgi:hypothetical protein
MIEHDDAGMVRAALDRIHVHVRVREQGLFDTPERLAVLRALIPGLVPFGTNHYAGMHAIVDWDHHLPSDLVIVRIYGAYSGHEARVLETQIRARDQAIEADNLYPEFDLMDYAELDASETYVGVWNPGADALDEFRFFANWRKDVRASIARAATGAVKKLDAYKRAYKSRANDALGSAVVVGWAPPCLAEGSNWAIEVWLVVEFDGQVGRAMVFMVDSDTMRVTREYLTEVHVA